MVKNKIVVLAIIFSALAIGCKHEAVAPVKENAFKHGTLLFSENVVAAFQSSDKQGILSVSTIGKSAQGRTIYMFKLCDGRPHKSVFIMCRQHGHEPGSALAVMQMMNDTLSGSGFANYLKDLNIYIVPEPNPDGAAEYIRFDSAENDLNRQWNDPISPEIKSLKAKISEIQPALVLDMHDYGSGGSFIELYNDRSSRSAFITPICRGISKNIRGQVDPKCRVAYSNSRNNPGLAHRTIMREMHIPAILVESRQPGTDSDGMYTDKNKCTAGHLVALRTALEML